MHVDDFERQKAAGGPPGAPAAAAQLHSQSPLGGVKEERLEPVKKVTFVREASAPAACQAFSMLSGAYCRCSIHSITN